MTSASTKKRTDTKRANVSCRTKGTSSKPLLTRNLATLLPSTMVRDLLEQVPADGPIGNKLAESLCDQYDLTEQYDVSPRRLAHFLRTNRAAPQAADKNSTPKPQDKVAEQEYNGKLDAYRQRQASIASILDTTFGELSTCNPDLWDRRAYLMLVGTVYERLSTSEELSTNDLVALAKALAESKRAETRRSATGLPEATQETLDQTGTPSNGELPPHFARVVRQVYGTNFHAPNEREHAQTVADNHKPE